VALDRGTDRRKVELLDVVGGDCALRVAYRDVLEAPVPSVRLELTASVGWSRGEVLRDRGGLADVDRCTCAVP
jgi:hypothetical protein